MSDFLKAISKLLADSADKVPVGWQTAEQIAKESNLSIDHTRRQLDLLVGSGAYGRKKFKIATKSRVIPVLHYKPASKK